MDICCYILFSEKLNKFYIGACSKNLASRIEKHNSHEYGNHRFTAASSDWILYLKINAIDYNHAIRLERKIKSMKSSVYIKNLKKYNELQNKIYLETMSTWLCR